MDCLRRFSVSSLIVCGLLAALDAQALSEKVVQQFVRWDHTTIWGVFAHKTSREYIVVTETGPVTLRSKDIRMPGQMFPEAQTVSQLLTIIAGNVEQHDFDRSRANLRELGAAIDAFEAAARPWIDARLETKHHRQECLQQTIAYYREQEHIVPGILEVLELHKLSTELLVEVTNDREPITRALLIKLIGLQQRLNAIGGPTDTVQAERDEASAALLSLQQRCLRRLNDAAVEQLKTNAAAPQAIGLMTTMGHGDGVHAIYTQQQALLLDAALEIVEDYRQRLGPTLTALMSVTANFEETRRSYTEAAAALKEFRQFLADLQPLIFGPDKEKLSARIGQAIASLDQYLESGSSTREQIIGLRQTLFEAALADERGEYRAAIDQYQTVIDTLGSEGDNDLLTKAQTGLLRATAGKLMAAAQTPETRELEANEALYKQLREFIPANTKQLEQIGYRLAPLETETNRLGNFVRFAKTFAKLVSQVESDPVLAWERKSQMDEWLQKSKGDVNELAHQQWRQFCEDQGERLYRAAVDAFLAQSATPLGAARLSTLRSFILYVMEADRLEEAAQLLSHGFDRLGEKPDPNVVLELVSLESRLAESYAATGAYAAAFASYDRIRKAYPDFTSDATLSQNMASLQLQLADSFLQQGNVDQAIDWFDRLIAAQPTFAKKANVVPRVIRMRIERIADENLADDERLTAYDQICERYPGNVRTVDEFRVERDRIVQRFEADWGDGRFKHALMDFHDSRTAYPHFAQELRLVNGIVPAIREQIDAFDASEQAGHPVPPSFTEAIQWLTQRYARMAEANRFDETLVRWRLNLAQTHLHDGDIISAHDIYQDVIVNFPAQAKRNDVQAKMQSMRWQYHLQRFQLPLGIRDQGDWTCFGVAIIILLLSLFSVLYQSVVYGHLRYRFAQFIAVTGAFALLFALLGATFFGEISFTTNFLIAYGLPLLVCNGFGLTTYRFFPLVYAARRLRFERFLLLLLRAGPIAREAGRKPLLLPGLANRLLRSSTRLARDMPLLHNRMLYNIQRARELALTDPQLGYNAFSRLLTRLNKEIGKYLHDESWSRHYGEVIFNLGMLARALGQPDDAKRYLEEHLSLYPKHAATHEVLGDVLFDSSDWEGATHHIKACLAAKGGDDDLWYKLGRCFFETARYKSAYKCFESVVDKGRNALFYGARSYARDHELDKAVIWFQRLLKKFPDDSEGMYFLASSLARHQQLDKADKIGGLFKANDMFHARALALQGSIRLKNGKMPEAREKFAAALKSDETCLPALVGIGQLTLESGQPDKASSIFTHVLGLDPANAAANFYLGIVVEKSDEMKAISHYNKSAESPDFSGAAHMRLGRLYLAKGLLDKAIQHFAIADAAHHLTSWYLYLYVSALVEKGNLATADDALGRLVGRPTHDRSWLDASPQLMYTLGHRLCRVKAYRLADQCFDFAARQITDETLRAEVEQQIVQCRFRLIVQLIDQGDAAAAQNVGQALKAQLEMPDLLACAQFYTALALLHDGKYVAAANDLTALINADVANLRYHYHLMIALIGQQSDADAVARLTQLEGRTDLPPHLRSGCISLRAMLAAREGNFKEALSLLETATDGGDFPGAAEVEQQITLSRIFYCCQIDDIAAAAMLTESLPEGQRARGVYWQAVAVARGKDIQTAKEIVAPFAETAGDCRRLFILLTKTLAERALEKKKQTVARSLFEAIPQPPPEIENVILGLNIGDVVARGQTVETTGETLAELSARLGQVSDRYLHHSLVHNIAILHLKRAIEAEKAGVESAYGMWIDCIDFWGEHVLGNREYWELEAERIASPSSEEITDQDIAAVNQMLLNERFVAVIVSFIIHYLDLADGEGCERHLSLLQGLGERHNQVQGYFSVVHAQYEEFAASVSRDDPRNDDWAFTMACMRVHARASELSGKDGPTAEELESALQARERYATPKLFRKAKREFNTSMLDALQQGASGKFTQAGDQLERVLRERPPGVYLGKLEGGLRILREAARQPQAAAEQGLDVAAEFDRLYAQMRNQNLRKTEDDVGQRKNKRSLRSDAAVDLR